MHCVLLIEMCAGKLKRPRVPDPPGGVRFCVRCEDFIPVEQFPSGIRRYLCKLHMWTTSGKRSKAKRLSDPRKHALSKMWGRCYDDSKQFKQKRIDIKQDEIDELLKQFEYVQDEIDDEGSPYEVIPHEIAIVPVEPTKMLSKSNAALVEATTRKALMRQLKNMGTEGYCRLLQKQICFWRIPNHQDEPSIENE